MPPRKRSETLPAELKTADYRHSEEKRINIPPARISGEGTVPQVPKARYAYSPHLTPALQFDYEGGPDQLAELAEASTQRQLTRDEAAKLKAGLRLLDPTLEWAGKREQRGKQFLEVDPVALHIHERVSARAIVRAALREDVQRDMFADPQQPYNEAVQFYRHDVDWANRLILGDSLQVMSSLARREGLAGKVQMVFMDPPYGVKFASNFQSEIGKREVKDKEQDLTREPEMVKAYRDTWTLGIHSYLSYLRDRLIVARELLTESGSIFVQISDENLHRVRALLDEVFGPENHCGLITFAKTTGAGSPSGGTDLLPQTSDYLLWYAREKATVHFRQLYLGKSVGAPGASQYTWVEEDGHRFQPTDTTLLEPSLGKRVFAHDNLTSQTGGQTTTFPVEFSGRTFRPNKGGWKTNAQGMERLRHAERLMVIGNSLRYVRYMADFPLNRISDYWSDTVISGFGAGKEYVVQTTPKVIERCVLMTTDPGDLVVDPTCGSGTTAVVSEQWGRRWIAIDTSRVALSIARKRILTSRFDYYTVQKKDSTTISQDPKFGFRYRTVAKIGLRTIAQNEMIDLIADRHRSVLEHALNRLNEALSDVSSETRHQLRSKLTKKELEVGKRGITEADRRRWLLPLTQWKEWEVPFDFDEAWPASLRDALLAYRKAWRQKLDEVVETIKSNADQEELVDQPEIVKGITRVSGPFTVEGVRPEELSLGEEGLFDGTPNEVPDDEHDLVAAAQQQNLQAYLERMVRLLRNDGLTFINNQRRKFSRVESLFEVGTGSVLHAEGIWAGEQTEECEVAIGFGPQFGPVTALHVEEFIRASKRYNELVIAGFSFDADATSLIQQYSSSKLRIHQAYIRPDVNPGMDGLLKETPNSQLFTVFGTPEIEMRKSADGEWLVELKGVDIYDPVSNTVRSTGAEKVAAWFLDSDFDGRCFAVTQAFFPDQDAWEKIAKALGTSADAEVFDAFNGTVSVPFKAGVFRRIAVKVIDPRGNEVMAVRALEG